MRSLAASAPSLRHHRIIGQEERGCTAPGAAAARFAPSTHRTAPAKFAFFTAKDGATAEEAGLESALWDAQSTGTRVNVAHLITRSKPAGVYVARTKTFSTLKTPDDLAILLSSADAGVRSRAEE